MVYRRSPFEKLYRGNVLLAVGLLLITRGLFVSPAIAQTRSPVQLPTAQTEPPPQSDSAYILGAGDILKIDLFRLPQYSGEQQVQADGSLNLPLIGAVPVLGLTLEQASERVGAAYSQVLRRPIATLTLLQRRPLVVGIAGEVNRPGSYTLTAEVTRFPNLSQLLETANGITQSADLRKVEIRRQTAQGRQVIRVDLWQLLETGDARYDITLRDGDSVFIPSTQVSLEDAPLLANASFYASSTEPVNVAVVGEVFRPGPYSLRGGPTRTNQAGVPGGEVGSNPSNVNQPVTVTDALQVAGGIKPKANLRQVQVRRITRSGQEQVIDVDLWKLIQSGDLRQNMILQEGDTVFVPTATEAITAAEATEMATASFSPNAINVNIVGEVQRSGTVAVPPNTPLNQAILAAGGFNTRAKQDSVLLIHLNPDGSVSRREVPIDFAQGIGEANNPVLQNNDIVIVGKSGLAGFSDTLGTVATPLSSLLNILTAPFRLFNLFN